MSWRRNGGMVGVIGPNTVVPNHLIMYTVSGEKGTGSTFGITMTNSNI